MAVIDAVADLDGAATLANLTRRTGLPKPTVRRIAADLAARGLLQRRDGDYRLGPRLFELGQRAAAQHELRNLAQPYLQELLARTAEIAFVLVFTESTSLLLDSAFGHNRASDMQLPWPTEIHSARFSNSAAGRLLLADRPHLVDSLKRQPLGRPTRYSLTAWPQLSGSIQAARDNGFAIEMEQSMLGYNCISAPIRDASTHAIAALGVLGRTNFAPARITHHLCSAASAVEQSLAVA
jgi:DNA-binding IclR family transcriptional regulator